MAYETEQWETYESDGEVFGEAGEVFGESGEVFGESETFGEAGESESEVYGESGEGEQFLGNILGSLVGETGDSPLNETEEVALANELLEIQDEEELDQFLGKIFKGVAKKVGGFIKSPIGKALGGALKGVAKTALPMVGSALGSFVLPGVGTALGGKLGSMASNLFEVDTESMEADEAQFEIARRYVKLAATAAKTAATAPRTAPPKVVVRKAIVAGARKNAPGLVKIVKKYAGPTGGSRGGYAAPIGGGYAAPSASYGGSYGGSRASYGGRPRAGRWVRRGRRIVLFGV